ncbi:MAG: LuxR C-terminal-related transcriptional regulator [Eggerthellaceae bacterium]|jgi:DNA-binding CsgD family transcriptional regulator|nr:LuxR C-terminal-related transcriptional regulator [Eggerthellaceae bacterium]MDR2715935.1 LuxR C-terminal-related transcriptional regulator [Coriobacteriaceae bacterium]
MNLRLFKPTIASFGYGLTIAIAATTIWGGAFPLLPLEVQTFELLTVFFYAQSIAFTGSFLLAMCCAYWLPHVFRHIPVSGCVFSTLLGSTCLIAPLYLPAFMYGLIVGGGILLGMGSAVFLILWQRVFASQDTDKGNLNLIIGTGYSALIYAVLHVIPYAVAAIVIAFVFIPLNGLCLRLSTQGVEFGQPMFDDLPRENAPGYRQIVRNRWRSALCVGCFGLVSGVIRALAVGDPSMGFVVNLASMAGALVSALTLVFLWQRHSFRFDPVLAFRTVFPYVVTSLLLPLLLGLSFLRVYAAMMYMIFTFASMIMMIQCAQTSRDYGINPVFMYGLFGTLVYSLQSVGFLAGYLAVPAAGPDPETLAVLAFFAAWFLSITLYFVRGHLKQADADPRNPLQGGSVEFIALEPPGVREGKQGAGVQPGPPEHFHGLRTQRESEFRDRISGQCSVVAKRYRLTARETEVIELIARGKTVAHIAELLVVSENTIRTHSKRAYVKLNVHKRQDLLTLLKEAGTCVNGDV